MIGYILDQLVQMFVGITNFFFGPVDAFRTPGMLFFLLIIPAYLAWYILWYSPRRLIVPLSYDAEKLVKGPNLSFLRFLPMVLQLAGLFLVILALARPVTSLTGEDRSGEGIDIMLVMDASGSMETPDFPPNRLEVAKDRAISFIEGRQSDRIGIVLFAEDAFSYAPLTMDYDLLKKQVRTITTRLMPKEGTAMGNAIALGIVRMRESKSPSKVMILLSDGASNRGRIDPITAAEKAVQYKIKIYSIAIGMKEYTITDPTFGFTQTIQNNDIDEETLQKVADMTGGKFFKAEDPASLGNVFTQISTLEKSKVEDTAYRHELDTYERPLLWGAIFIACAFLLMLTFLNNPLEE